MPSTKNKNIKYLLLFVGPAIIYMCIFSIYPIFYNFYLATQNLTAKTFAAGSEFVGFETVLEVIDNGLIGDILINTVVFTVACVIFQLILGLGFGMLFNKHFKSAGFLRGIMLMAWMFPMTVTAILFKFMFQTDIGIINYVLGLLSIDPVPWLTDPTNAMWALILANTWIGIPFDMVLFTNGLKSINDTIYESCDIDGANRFQKFWFITLPLLKPTMLAILSLGVVYTFKVFDLVVVMTSGGPANATEMFSTYAYQLSFKEFNFSEGAVVSCIMFIILFFVGLIYVKNINEDEVIS